MGLTRGMKLESFEIVDLLGVGGMGEVYRARDTRLNREVAIKVLPEAFATDPERLSRFQREAHVLASLNHPNIGAIHGLQESSGSRFLVLELVKGETLASRLKRGPVPVDDAVELLKQIASALEAAHEKGVLHRDLKPANIQITPEGVVKVLDFGLAKMLETDVAAPNDPSNSPTLSVGQTLGGAILGTAAYMSPEQARGRTVDKRTDIWAFGCVAYEMLTGQQAFGGETVTDIVAAVMKGEPDWSRLPAVTPSHLRLLLRQCLRKQAKERLHEIADARIALGDAFTETVLPAAASAARVPARRWMVLAFLVLVILPVVGFLAGRMSDSPVTTYLSVSLGRGEKLVGSISSVRPSRTAFAVHPEGKVIVFNGDALDSPPRLYMREFEKPEAVPITGTESARGPFFSPDGQWIGFFANGQIKKVPVAGGPAVVISDVSKDTLGLFGASWSEDGTIFFSDRSEGISKVSSSGGTAEKLTTSDGAKGERHLLPYVLPGGNAVVFTSVINAEWARARIMVYVPETKEIREVVQGGADARYVSTGHLLFIKLGALTAVPFDTGQLRKTGEPLALIDNVMQAVNSPNGDDETGSGQFALSRTGTLVYAAGGVHSSVESSLVWVDRKAGPQPLTWIPPGTYRSPRLSPDQSKVILVRFGASRTSDVWVFDVLRGAPTQLTSSGSNWPALWSPDGKRVLFSSDATGVKNLYLANADGSRRSNGSRRANTIRSLHPGRQEITRSHISSPIRRRCRSGCCPWMENESRNSFWNPPTFFIRNSRRMAAGSLTYLEKRDRMKSTYSLIRVLERNIASRRKAGASPSGQRTVASCCSAEAGVNSSRRRSQVSIHSEPKRLN